MSKQLDQELAEAIVAGGDVAAVAKRARPKDPTRPPNANKNIGFLLTLLAMVGAVVGLFLGVFQPAAVYATPVDELVREQQAFTGRKVRVEASSCPARS